MIGPEVVKMDLVFFVFNQAIDMKDSFKMIPIMDKVNKFQIGLYLLNMFVF